MVENVFSCRLRAWRAEHNLSQEQAAELMHVSTRALQTWESGTQFPRLDTFLLIADTMNVSLDFLAGRESIVVH
jgi:transcriptional regulator with XRE-family HTH domain